VPARQYGSGVMVRCSVCGSKVVPTGATKSGDRIGARVQKFFEYRCENCGKTVWSEEVNPGQLKGA
jgi:DNA-directed RNA polymerase subunit RPC12/RpoP